MSDSEAVPAGETGADAASLLPVCSFVLADAVPANTRPNANAVAIPAEATVRGLRILFSSRRSEFRRLAARREN
jgi:hypothetical protein